MPLYFAYGSNMDSDDLIRWCARNSCEVPKFSDTEPAILKKYKLDFNYFSTFRQSGAANIMPESSQSVYGLVSEISDADMAIVSKKEGFPAYYEKINITVETLAGATMHDVITFKAAIAREKSSFQPPSRYYLDLILANARKHGFPSHYIQKLESFPCKT